jgi:hypothetical protein
LKLKANNKHPGAIPAPGHLLFRELTICLSQSRNGHKIFNGFPGERLPYPEQVGAGKQSFYKVLLAIFATLPYRLWVGLRAPDLNSLVLLAFLLYLS